MPVPLQAFTLEIATALLVHCHLEPPAARVADLCKSNCERMLNVPGSGCLPVTNVTFGILEEEHELVAIVRVHRSDIGAFKGAVLFETGQVRIAVHAPLANIPFTILKEDGRSLVSPLELCR